MKYHFFWKGPLSQWHTCTIEYKGIKYNCAEQLMMAEKARLFGDNDTLRKIMLSNSPKDQKAWGRKVRNFNNEVWSVACKDIVYNANYLKFTQNEYLKKILLNTKGELVEASPYDKVWGAGLSAEDPLINDKKNWPGKNLLGEILTMVRDRIIREENDPVYEIDGSKF